jgi:hypothetical protein
MFLELTFQVSLTVLEQSIDLQEGRESDFVKYFIARQVVEYSYSKISKGFKEVIKRCLYYDFRYNNNFTSPAL